MTSRRVTLQLDEDLWRRVRLTALQKNVTASQIVERALIAYDLTGRSIEEAKRQHQVEKGA